MQQTITHTTQQGVVARAWTADAYTEKFETHAVWT